MQASDMVEDQIIGRDIKDKRLLNTMLSVPRHLFVPKKYADSAYIDRPLPIGERQTISQPYMVAKMTELLQVEPGMRILEIGTGSGYQSAILAFLGARVWSLERVEHLAQEAKERLHEMNLNVDVFYADGRQGYRDAAPYDRVIVTAAATRVEHAWDEQLAPNGRMILPLDVATGGQRLLLREKLVLPDASVVFQNTWYDYCRFVPLLVGTD